MRRRIEVLTPASFLRSFQVVFLLFPFSIPAMPQNNQPPQADISNGVLHASLYLPDPVNGFYRGTRFDWSGVIHSLTYQGHDYYGPWFTKTDPEVIDFIFKGPDIVAGPCSAITGPVEEFVWQEKALGFDQAKAGGTFIKIGVGVLRKPDDQEYSPYRLYPIVDSGKWTVHKKADSVEFIQEISDPASGYGYRYTKTVRLSNGKPEMILEHKLENTGRLRNSKPASTITISSCSISSPWVPTTRLQCRLPSPRNTVNARTSHRYMELVYIPPESQWFGKNGGS